MEALNTTESSDSLTRYWLRVLRPLFWWLVLVFILYAVRTHQKLMEKTNINFNVLLSGKPFPFGFDGTATFDDHSIANGDLIPLGRHTFAVSHPKAKTFKTNFFVWYGKHDFGEINLARGVGTLNIKSDPIARTINIRGPESSGTLTNSTGTTVSVPSDTYIIEADYGHSRENAEVSVSDGNAAYKKFAPALGQIQLKCNQEGASFQLQNVNGQIIESGEIPAIVMDLPQGNYDCFATHHGNQIRQRITVQNHATNESAFEFLYGSVTLKTKPAGAEVFTKEGRMAGTTPLILSEVPTGERTFILRRDGFEAIQTTLHVTLNETNSFQTNLLSLNYGQAMATARQHMANNNYIGAVAAVTDALSAKPDDADALVLKREASGKANIQQAGELANRKDYTAAIRSLNAALEALPDNEMAKQRLVELQAKAKEQARERLERPRKVFETQLAKITDSDLFESHELKTEKTALQVNAAVIHQLTKISPTFTVMHKEKDEPPTGVFKIEARQEVPGGWRQAIVVVGQAADDETQILFKVLEFKNHHKIGLQGLLQLSDTVEHIPVHPSRIPEMNDKLKAQVEEGARIVSERIEHAIK